MLVPNQLVEVKVISKTLEHYRKLGYEVKKNDIIMVPPEHLTNGSHSEVEVICDICKAKISRPYKQYLEYHKVGYDTCKKCKQIKLHDTCMSKYGVSNPMLVSEFKERLKNTVINLYGVDSVFKIEKIQQQKMKTLQRNFGVTNPMFSAELRDKLKTTMMMKYGCENPMQNKEFVQKAQLTNLQKYGVKNPQQNPQIKAKTITTLAKNGAVPTSSQQIKLYEIIKKKYPDAELNYPCSTCSLDIFIEVDSVKIDCEYDAWFFHQDQQKDIKRDKFLQSQGFKTLRVRSGHLLPTEQELFDAIDYLVNTEHHFKEIILSDWKIKEDEECQKQLQVAQ
jgi:hypothetical protein